MIDKIVGGLARLLLVTSVVIGTLMGLLVGGSALSRYLFNFPIHFTEEVVGLAFAALFFFSLPYCSYASRHISVSLISHLFPAAATAILIRIGHIAMALFLALLGNISIRFVEQSYMFGSKSDVLSLQLGNFMLMFPVFCFLCAAIHVLIALNLVGADPAAEEHLI